MIVSATPYTDTDVSNSVKKVNKIIGYALTATMISTILARIINLLVNFGLSTRIINVMKMVEELDCMVRWL